MTEFSLLPLCRPACLVHLTRWDMVAATRYKRIYHPKTAYTMSLYLPILPGRNTTFYFNHLQLVNGLRYAGPRDI